MSGSKGRGIYLREPHEVGVLCKASVTVEPKFPVDTGIIKHLHRGVRN